MPNNLKVTSRDYASIYQELKEEIPEVTKIWNTNTEADPGLVLVKLMAMFGDMLSYNRDKSILELYPDSVTQRKNAAQVFGLMGYKMRWYRAAQCVTYLTNTSNYAITIPRYSIFMTRGEELQFTNLNQLEVGPGTEIETTLYQGVPVTPSRNTDRLLAIGENEWHSIYNFNITKENIVNNRIYVDNADIDESSIVLIDNLGDTWIQSENVSAETSTNKYYELKIDNNDRPYIKLVSYWNTFTDVEKFKLFYISTKGEEGQVAANTITDLRSNVMSGNELGDPVSISIRNNDSTYGYNPETPDEARDESAKYINTYNTLITLDDFTKFVRRLNGVANCYVTDFTTDPYRTASAGYSPLVKYEVKLYVTRMDNYRDVERSIYRNYILNEVSSSKIYPLTVRVVIDEQQDGEAEPATRYFDWTVAGTLYYREPISVDRSKEIIAKINRNLEQVYALQNMEYNTLLKYTDVVNTITNTDPLISYIDLDAIQYYTDFTDPETLVANPKSVIAGKFTKNVLCYSNGLPDYNPSSPTVDGAVLWLDSNERYILHMTNVPVKPGSVCIRLENNEYVVVDDKNGSLVCNSSFLNHGTVDYDDGTIDMYLNGKLYGDFSITYQENKIGLVRFAGIDSDKLIVDVDSIKK